MTNLGFTCLHCGAWIIGSGIGHSCPANPLWKPPLPTKTIDGPKGNSMSLSEEEKKQLKEIEARVQELIKNDQILCRDAFSFGYLIGIVHRLSR